MYTFESTVRYSECDEHCRLSLVSLINYLQDCSTFHTESLGLGIEHMASHHFAWLLAAWQIQILEIPRFCDRITVGTWCYDMKRTLAQRNFQICNKEGRPLVKADSLWFTFDTLEGKPIRIPESEYAYLSDEPRLDMPPTTRKLKVAGDWIAASPITVNESHLDTNQHVNNAQYVLMALEALGRELSPDVIRVQYRIQARLGDVLYPRLYPRERGWAVELCRSDGDAYAVVEMEAGGVA